MEVFKVRRIVLDEIDVDSILFDPTAPDIFYLKHDVGASNATIYIGNLDADNLSVFKDAFPVLTYSNAAIKLLH